MPRMVITRCGVLLAAGLFWAAGCSGSPFRDDVQIRTPYERYQVLRGQATPKTVVDSFGREQPNLRGRLAPPGAS